MPQPYIDMMGLLEAQGARNVDAMRQAQAMKLADLQMMAAQEEMQQKKSLRDLLQKDALGAVEQPQPVADTLGIRSYKPEIADQIWGAGATPEGQAMADKWTQLKDLPMQTQGGFNTQKYISNLLQSGDPLAVEQALKMQQQFAGEKPQLVEVYEGGKAVKKWMRPGEQTGVTVGEVAPKEVSRWSEPYQMGGATVQRNIDTGEIRTAVSRPAPTASTTVVLKQEGEEAKAVGKGFGEQYMDIQKSGLQASNKIAKLDRMSNLLQGVQTGKLVPTMTQISALADSLAKDRSP